MTMINPCHVNNMIKTFLVDNGAFNGCNKNCEYCRKDKKIDGDASAVEKSLSLLETNVSASILKISGYGEITKVKNWKQIVGRHDGSYDRAQVITNATLLTREDIDWLASRNYNLCVSLDGTSILTNGARNSSETELAIIMENMRYAHSLRVPLEVNTVLTSFNINGLEPLLDFVESLDGVCYPFPVRENRLYGQGKSLKPSERDTEKNIGKLIQKSTSILPPRAYLENLMLFMLGGYRDICYVPKVMIGISPQGDLLKCPCSGTQRISNIFSEGKQAFARYSEQRAYGGNDDECSDCFTHYEVINLFLDGKISPKEMDKMPLFRKLDLTKLTEMIR